MTQQMQWTTLWVDSTDRRNWQQRVRDAFNLPGVEQIVPNAGNGQVRVRYNPSLVTTFQLSTHLRAAGL